MARSNAVIRVLTLSCRDAAVLVSRSADEDLGRADRWALRLHLLICAPCRLYRRQLGLLRDMVRGILGRLEREDLPADARLSPEGRQRLRALVAARSG